LNGCRGGLGGGGEREFVNLSDFEIDTVEDERNKTVFKFEFLFDDDVLFAVKAGKVDEPFVTRRLFRLEILSNALGFRPLVSINKPFGTTSLLKTYFFVYFNQNYYLPMSKFIRELKELFW
jgi:hypothetical protein